MEIVLGCSCPRPSNNNNNSNRALDISTRKLLTMYKCFSMKDDVDRLCVPRQRGGRGLLSVEDVLHHEQLSLAKYLATNGEPLLQAVFQ